MTKKLLALLLALILALSVVPALADYPAAVFPTDYTGKTVILHSNDVHGAIDGYAYIAWLRD